MSETAIAFGGGRSLVGVFSDPPAWQPASRLPAVIILNSGLVHRSGPARLSVRLARGFAARGLVALRFDLSGIGDSRAATERGPTGERWIAETRAAMDMLAEARGVDRFVLVGNCSGAAVSFGTALADRRVVALGLINPQPPSRLRYYLRLALTNPKFWKRLTGGVAKIPSLQLLKQRRQSSAPSASIEAVREPRKRDPMSGLHALAERGVDMLMLHCEWDPGYDYFHRAVRPQLERPPLRERVQLAYVAGANHDFSLTDHQRQLLQLVDDWAVQLRGTWWR
jgi:alpha-beta hydrolase superfamily lysophospholipase